MRPAGGPPSRPGGPGGPGDPAAGVGRPGRSGRLGRALEVGIGLYGAAVFTVLWAGFAVGLLTGGDLLVDAWAWLTGLDPAAAVVAWILLLPIAVGLWAWNAAGLVVMALVGVGLVAWTLLAISGLLKVIGRSRPHARSSSDHEARRS